jgi:lysophospholipase L1-like esterase
MTKSLCLNQIFARRPWIGVLALIAGISALVVVSGPMLNAQTTPTKGTTSVTPAPDASRWIDAWALSYLPTLLNGTPADVPAFSNQTVRLSLFTRLGGSQERVKFTNKFQTVPLVIGAAHLALGVGAGGINPRTDRALTFGGAPSVTIPPGEERWSDAVNLAVVQHTEMMVSVFLPESLKPTAFHLTGLKTGYFSAPGNHATDPTMPPAEGKNTTTSVFFVSGLQVMAPARTKVIVAFGDSITDGANSDLNSNTGWPEQLSKRLSALPDGTPVSVINMGIGSNRIVSADAAGPSGVHRFADDVLARPNVTHVIVFEGINDISYEQATPEQLIKGYQEVIARAHAQGLKVYGVTLLPIQNSRKDTPANEATRQVVNQWIRTAKDYDAVLDFEKIVQDPDNPLRIRKDLTRDYVHPNTAGYKLMADSIDLKLFE